MSAILHSFRHSFRHSARLRDSRFTLLFIFVTTMAAALCAMPASAQDKSEKALSASAAAAASDPVLAAMREELERSKAHLKMENIAAPYYIEYSVLDSDEYDAEAAFGALRQKQRSHGRSARVVVRVGDYKLDSYYGPGTGFVDLAPVDDDATALRHQLWLATDRAYKAASQALAAKKAVFSQFSSGQPFDDFAAAPALQSIGPWAKLDFDPAPYNAMLEKATDLFRTDPKIQSLTSQLRFRAVNRYFVNTEGTVTRRGLHGLFHESIGRHASGRRNAARALALLLDRHAKRIADGGGVSG